MIADTREKALEEHHKVLTEACGPSTVIAYTDGSGTDKGVGAAVLAKGAADSVGTSGPVLVLYASLRRRLRALTTESWRQLWADNAHGASLRRVLATPSRAVLKLHAGQRRAVSSVVVQMQTGKIALASYLISFGALPTTDCACGHDRQDVQHILIVCPTYAGLQLRAVWQRSRETNYARLLCEPDLVRQAARFMIATRLLGQFRGFPDTFQ
ncbi:hypothetical protein KXX16_004844, partial [Aspergillus fumigatus]